MKNELNLFVEQLKKQLASEFQAQDRKGVYAFTQKNMAYNSNKIEGSTLTSEQTASLFDTGTIISIGDFEYRTKDVEEMTGHFKMFNEVVKSMGKPLSIEMIKSFHYQLKSGVFEDYINGYPVGEFKNRSNQVSDIVTELPQNIPFRMAELVEQYNKSSQGLTDIAKFHAEYEHIHPFQDGNGRTGRAIIFKQCLDSGIVPVIISDDEKMKYYHALHSAQVDKDFHELLSFFEDMQEKYYNKIKDFIIMPTNEMEQALELTQDFKNRLLSQDFVKGCKVDSGENASIARCIIRKQNLMIGIDFSKGETEMFDGGNIVTPLELKANDKEKYEFYHNVKCTLKAYMNEKSDTRFKKFFKKYECSNPSIPTGRGD